MSHFQQRHYRDIACAMQDAHPKPVNSMKTQRDYACEMVQWDYTLQRLADVFAADNGKFKRDLFMRACVPGANVRARS